jgi:hypothetical protein
MIFFNRSLDRRGAIVHGYTHDLQTGRAVRVLPCANLGISVRHGPHHVAQKFSSTTLPRKLLRVRGLPSRSVRVKSGATPEGTVAGDRDCRW